MKTVMKSDVRRRELELRPRYEWMNDVELALGRRNIDVEEARKRTRDGFEHIIIVNVEFDAAFMYLTTFEFPV